MRWRDEWKPLAALIGGFAFLYFLPIDRVPTGEARLGRALFEGLALAVSYSREHVLFCLVPAFFIAGAISVMVRRGPVLRLMGPSANPAVAYAVASVAGTVLAVCSCTVLPLFAGIYAVGAGLGPATAFLYSGPAINVLAVILTARVLGAEIGVARGVGAVLFAVVLGIIMAFVFRKGESTRDEGELAEAGEGEDQRLRHTVLLLVVLVGILVAANFGRPERMEGLWYRIYSVKWDLTALLGAALGLSLVRWFGLRRWILWGTAGVVAALAVALPGHPALPFAAGVAGLVLGLALEEESTLGEWLRETWGFTKQIVPLLFAGVLVAGFVLGRPGQEGIMPSGWVTWAVGGNTALANLSASVAGAFMYFATLTEVPILQGLLGSGMGKGPALALLLAGPAVSLPSLLVIRSVLGTKKTAVFTLLVVVMATVAGLTYGTIWS